jgi:thiamine biosynthesis protein ThiC
MMGWIARSVNAGGVVLAFGAALVAGATPAEGVRWDAVGVGLGAILAAVSPMGVVLLRIWAAHLKDQRERRRRDAEMTAELAAARERLDWTEGRLNWTEGQLDLKDRRITDLEFEVADTRAHQNQTRARVRPPLPPLPPGPVERRLADSGQYPAVPEVTD